MRSIRRNGLVAIFATFLILCLSIHSAYSAGTFIPAPDRVDMVHDPLRNILYIASGADVLRYHLDSQQFLEPFRLGGHLTGIDLSPDGNTLAVADNSVMGIHLIDLQAGSSQKISFAPDPCCEFGSSSVAFGSDGSIVFATGDYWDSVRKYNPATGETTAPIHTTPGGVLLSGSADGSTAVFLTSDPRQWGHYRLNDGRVESMSGLFGSLGSYSSDFRTSYEIGVNRNGTQFAIPSFRGTYLFNSDFVLVGKVGHEDGQKPMGVVYDPAEEIVYFSWQDTKEVRAYETRNFAQVRSYDFEHTFQFPPYGQSLPGRLKVSRDGTLLFALVEGGIHYVHTQTDATPSYTLTVQTTGPGVGFVASSPAGLYCPSACAQDYTGGRQVVLTATPLRGSVFSGWSGAGCVGTGTCTVNVDEAKTVTAAFAKVEDSGRGDFIPCPNRADMVHDPVRNLIYITSGGDVLRYSLDAKQFLAPFRLEGELRGIELSPDSNTLAVADYSIVGMHLIDLRTDSARKVFFPPSGQYGSYSVAFGSDGNIVASVGDWYPLFKYTLSTGEAVPLPQRTRGLFMVSSSADGGSIGFSESGTDGPGGRYRVSDGNIVERIYPSPTYSANYEIGANRNGTQFALLTYSGMEIYSSDFIKLTQIGPNYASSPAGVVYDPLEDIVYFSWNNTSEVRAYETDHFTQVRAYDFGHVFKIVVDGGAYQQGRLKISRDGTLLFATVEGGIHYVRAKTDAMPSYPLTVDTTGTDSGFITSSPAGMYCPSVCTQEYPGGQQVTLTATPLRGFVFSGWSGAGCSGAGACTINVDGAKTVTATFIRNDDLGRDNFIASTNPADMVHDPIRNLLYITAGTDVLRYNLETKQFLAPFRLGGDLQGIDLSPDANTLVVADRSMAGIHLIDLSTGLSRKLLSPDNGDQGSSSAVFGNDGNVIVASGWSPLRKYNPATGEVTVLVQEPGAIMVSASADGNIIDFSPNGPFGPWGRYRVNDGAIVARSGYPAGISSTNYYGIGTSRDGSQFAILTDGGAFIYNPDFFKMAQMTSGAFPSVGVVYDPAEDIVYLAWANTQEVCAYDTRNFLQVKSYNSGRTFPYPQYSSQGSPRRLKISRDGTLLFAMVEGGIHYVHTKTDAVPSHRLTVRTAGLGAGSVTSSPAGMFCPSVCVQEYASGRQVTLTATPLRGSVFSGWSGAGCAGTGTCTVTADEAKTVTAIFAQGDDSGRGDFISSPNRADMVHDPVRNILYITSGPDVLRYSLDAKGFLAPFHLGGDLRGTDLSPDGNTLAVADNSITGIHLIDLRTDAMRKVFFPSSGQYGSYSVAFGSDGSIVVSGSSYYDSLRKYNPATGEVTTLIQSVSENTALIASADGSVIGYKTTGSWGYSPVNDGNIAEYSPTDTTTGANREVGINRDGTQFAIPKVNGTFIYNSDFVPMAKIGSDLVSKPLGVVYDPLSDIVYFAWAATPEVRAYETNEFERIHSYNFGYTFQEAHDLVGHLKISRDGTLLFAVVEGGIRYVEIYPRVGDLDHNRTIGLADAIAALQISSGVQPLVPFHVLADANRDHQIGMAEVIYDLQMISGLRGNRKPILNTIGDIACYERKNLSFTLSATDQDYDPLVFSAASLPADALFDEETRTFSWTPQPNQIGTHEVTFTVRDAFGGQTSETIRIAVNKAPAFIAADYYPLNVGDWFDYDLNTPSNTYRMAITGTKIVGDAAAKICSYTQGSTDYNTSDESGVKLYGQYNPSSGTEVLFSSPLLLIPENMALGTGFESSASWTYNYAGYPYQVNITSYTEYLALEDVQTENETLHDCIKVSGRYDQYIVERNQFVPGETIYRWFYKGVGIVKEAMGSETLVIKRSNVNGVTRNY